MDAFFFWTLVILFATHLVGGLAAFGSTLLALPLLLLVGWELRPAVGVLLIVGSVQAVSMAVLTGRGADRAALLRMLLVAGAGLPVGFLFAHVLPQTGLQVVLGVVLAAAGASRLIEHWRKREWRPPAWALWTLLGAGGIIHGAFGSGGATLTVYGRYALPTKEAFRGTLSIMWVVLNVFVIGGLIAEGSVGGGVAKVALPGAVAILAATLLGHRLAERLSQARFRDVVAGLLCVAGAVTIARSLGGI
ncbi:MAG: TSUP family transporter [Phycisphaeraceae bacterium]